MASLPLSGDDKSHWFVLPFQTLSMCSSPEKFVNPKDLLMCHLAHNATIWYRKGQIK